MECVLKSPKIRLAVTLFLTIVIGVFSSLFATEITPNGIVEWSRTFKAYSFWILIILSAIWLWIHINLMEYDNSILAFSDDEYCKAYMRKAQLEAYVLNIKENPKEVNTVELNEFKSRLEGYKK